MPGRVSAIAVWAWILAAVLLIVIFFVSFRVVHTQRHLQELQTKLDQATTEAKSTQSELKDEKSRLEAVQSELVSANQVGQRLRPSSCSNRSPVSIQS